mmetsp:Transcript_9366/g.42647  ORF Transcript_9366/g.42647 Transcript_9366/m.42647 type:complete len:327 (+) Transcript_9366:392-1372(+)
MRTQDTVLGPTPLNRESSALTSSSGMSRRYSIEHSPRSSTKVFRMTWMRLTLISASPPHRMASSTFVGFAVRTASHVGNRCLRMANARCELVSVVFCERIVPTRESSTVFLGTKGASPSGVRGAGSAGRDPGPIASPPAACCVSNCWKKALWSCARASLAAQHSISVGLARLGKGLPTVPSPAFATTSALDSVFGVLGVPLLDCGGSRTVGEAGSIFSALTVTHAADASSFASMPGSVLILTEVFARLAVGVSVAAAAATPRVVRLAAGMVARMAGLRRSAGFIHSRGGMGQDGKQSGTKSTSPGVSRRFDTRMADSQTCEIPEWH